ASEHSCPRNRRPGRIACCREVGATGPRIVAMCPSRRLASRGTAYPGARRQTLLRCSFPSPESLAIRFPGLQLRLLLLPDAAFSPWRPSRRSVLGDAREFGREMLEVLCAASKKQWAASGLYGADDVVDDHLVA